MYTVECNYLKKDINIIKLHVLGNIRQDFQHLSDDHSSSIYSFCTLQSCFEEFDQIDESSDAAMKFNKPIANLTTSTVNKSWDK